MARRQYEREQAARRHARRFLFCDTNAWTTLHWSLHSYDTADVRLHELVDRTVHEYLWVVCDNDFGWIQDGTREMAGAESVRFQEQQIADLDRRRILYTVVSGPVEQRIARVEALIADPSVQARAPS
jgi:nicotinamide riboside kinase